MRRADTRAGISVSCSAATHTHARAGRSVCVAIGDAPSSEEARAIDSRTSVLCSPVPAAIVYALRNAAAGLLWPTSYVLWSCVGWHVLHRDYGIY